MESKLNQHFTLPARNKKRYGEGGLRIKNKKKKPLFSIITVVLNNDKYLEQTIKSVLGQTFTDYEYIIIDGGSKDNSINIIKKFEDRIDYWLSEEDNGIYDAFNKGISLAFGKYIGIINSDDAYNKNGLEIISRYIKKNNNTDFIFGSVKKHWGVLHGYEPKKIWYSWGFYSSHSTGFFIKNESAKKVGLYNLKYKYHADYDYFYRMIVKHKLKGISTKKDEVTGIFRRGGYSSTISFWKLFFEELRIRFDNGQNLFIILIIFIYKVLKNIDKVFIKKGDQ